MNGRTALKFLLKVDDSLRELTLETYLVEGHTHDAALLGDGLQDTLAYPPHGVTDEFETTGFVKLLGSLDEA